jgi:hypothetical protein
MHLKAITKALEKHRWRSMVKPHLVGPIGLTKTNLTAGRLRNPWNKGTFSLHQMDGHNRTIPEAVDSK